MSGVDFARQALVAAQEAARKNGGARQDQLIAEGLLTGPRGQYVNAFNPHPARPLAPKAQLVLAPFASGPGAARRVWQAAGRRQRRPGRPVPVRSGFAVRTVATPLGAAGLLASTIRWTCSMCTTAAAGGVTRRWT